MKLARSYFAIAWLAVFVLAVIATWKLGLGGIAVFFTDFSHPWRAQFYTDLTVHVTLVAGWIVYRERSSAAGILWAVGVFLCGGVVTFAYLLIVSAQAGGDPRRLLLGRNYASA